MDYQEYLIRSGLQADSAASYDDYLQRVVAELGVDLAACNLSDAGIADLDQQLEAAKVTANSRRNCLTALRAYADFLSGQPRRSRRGQAPRLPRDQNV